MTPFGWVQLFIDVLFLFLILVLLVARGWRRGPLGAPGTDEQESYRGMIATLSEMIKRMKESTFDMQERLSEKQTEIQHTIAAAEDRLARMKEELKAMESRPKRPVSAPAPRKTGGAKSETEARDGEHDNAAEESGPREATINKEEERRAKYRQALELMEKGWGALDIARFTQLPSGEVEFLMRTKGRPQ